MKHIIIFAVALFLLQCFSNMKSDAIAKTSISDPVKISAGLVEGETLKDGIKVYKGIPFAAPPVNDLRWKAPQKTEGWKGIRKAFKYGPACQQPDMSKLTMRKYETISEDCLYLNVWTPAGSVDEKLPVMVWFHGGAFMVGTASDDYYDGQDLARRGVIVVTVNYRLGPFGFLAHPLLSKESEHSVSGNYGLLDQIIALKWVRDNIAAFGGDPGRVTIFGESGGGRSVAHLMVAPMAKGLFHRGIMQSSTVYRAIHHLRESWYGRPAMETVGKNVSGKLGCNKASDPLACMRKKSPEEILAVSNASLAGVSSSKKGTPYEPIVDGWLIPDDPSDLFDAGKQHNIPLIIGSNADEGTLFIQKMSFWRIRKIRKIIEIAFPDHYEEVLKVFPFKWPKEAKEAMNRITGDVGTTAPVRRTLRNMEKVEANAWQYFFSHRRSDYLGKKFGAYHGSEIRFVFNSLDRSKGRVEDVDRRVSDIMSEYWVRFAATGTPNGNGLPDWPPYDYKKRFYMELGDKVQVKQNLRSASCDLFEKIEEQRRANRRQTVK